MTHKVPTRLSIFERTITQVFRGRKISSILNSTLTRWRLDSNGKKVGEFKIVFKPLRQTALFFSNCTLGIHTTDN